MRRWLFALLSAVVASGVGVSVNLATELGTNVWAWVAVGVLTLAAAGVAVWMGRGQEQEPAEERSVVVQNSVTGNVTGSVLQAKDISGSIHLGGPDQPGR